MRLVLAKTLPSTKMRLLLLTVILCLATSTLAKDDTCDDQGDSCSHETEYNAYITCLQEHRRHKRSYGCPNQVDSCEFVDCQQCQENCEPTCQACNDCSNTCRQCCSETCTTNLCCHKTCHNQCKTNHCRAECKKECKGKLDRPSSSLSSIDSKHDSSIDSRHNITTIINLHNIINNTNLIDIPIKINNTNYNNITLKREGSGFVQVGGSTSLTEQVTTNEAGENCCQVIGPRHCNKTDTFPFLKCFHYRYKQCGPICTAPIVHSRPQHICDQGRCHNRVVYIPQPQPRCYYQPAWPYVSCGGVNSMQKCHGCYDHLTARTQHVPQSQPSCSKCYDDGFGVGPYYRQGPFYRPGFSYVPSCLQVGTCGYPAAPPVYAPPPPPMYGYPGYGYPGLGNPGYINPGYAYPGYVNPAMMNPGFGYPAFGYENFQDISSGGVNTKSLDNSETNYIYPNSFYVPETIIPAININPNLTGSNDSMGTVKDTKSLEEETDLGNKKSRYALISIDTTKAHHHDKKDKRIKRKKDHSEHVDKSQVKVDEELNKKLSSEDTQPSSSEENDTTLLSATTISLENE